MLRLTSDISEFQEVRHVGGTIRVPRVGPCDFASIFSCCQAPANKKILFVLTNTNPVNKQKKKKFKDARVLTDKLTLDNHFFNFFYGFYIYNFYFFFLFFFYFFFIFFLIFVIFFFLFFFIFFNFFFLFFIIFYFFIISLHFFLFFFVFLFFFYFFLQPSREDSIF